MQITVKEITDLVQGSLEGNGSTVIQGAAGLLEAKSSDISFLGNPKYAQQISLTKAGALLLSKQQDVSRRLVDI